MSGAGEPDLSDLFDHIDQQREPALQRLFDYLRRPSISAHGQGIAEVADYIAGIMRDIGLTTRVDRQHSQMPCRGVAGGLEQDAPRELRTLVVAHQQQGAVSRRKSPCQRGRICPRSGKQPDLVGPAGTLAPVRGIDQRDDIADVGISGGRHDHVSTAG